MTTTMTAAVPEDDNDPAVSPTRRKHYVQLMMSLALIMVAAATWMTFLVFDLVDKVEVLEANQNAGKERTYKSQALTCSIKLAIGGDVTGDAACQDPNVLELYDEDAEPVAEVLGVGGGG